MPPHHDDDHERPHRHQHKHGPPGPPHHRHHARDRTLARFVDRDRIDRLLAPWVPDEDDRAFVLRCLLDEGPVHHRGVNWILLALLGELEGERPTTLPVGEHVRVPLRLPPHLRHEYREDDEDGAYPLPLPLAPLRRLAGNDARAVDAMVECLTDGPPQHALANAAMVLLIDALMRR